VHPLYRGQGLGTAIVRQVLGRASSLRVCRVHVSCITQRSAQFWGRFGFPRATPTQTTVIRSWTTRSNYRWRRPRC
jgi:GNAT superfamily N-acetyltransferase